MAASRGRSILLKISDGTSPGAFTSIAGLRSKTITINNETVDITTSDDAPWRQLLGNTGIRSVSMSGSGVFQDDAAVNDVEDLAMNGLAQEFQMVFENGDIIQGFFQVTSFEYGGEHTAEQTYSVSFESSANVTLIRA
ncbi:MAG: phage major tail protein, TP901-1 family [Candidatus Odinarchaeia archaeon]